MIVESTLTVIALATLLAVGLSHRLLVLSTTARRERRPLDAYPSVTVIRPIKGLDAGAAENMRVALREHGYPGEIETLFVFDDENEPAMPLALQAIEEHVEAGRTGDARVLICGAPPAFRTGKLHAMIAGLREARGDLIVFADSDIRPGPEALTALIETLATSPGAGSSFAPVVVTSAPRTVGDAGYAVLINGMYGPAAAESARRNGGELPFIMGQFMAWTREALEAIGGLECADGQLVDDMYLGQRTRAAGYRNVVSPRSVPIIQEGLASREFLGIYRRWIAFSRSGLPGAAFKLSCYTRVGLFFVAAAIAAVALAAGAWIAVGLSVPAACLSLWSVNRLHCALGGAPLGVRLGWVTLGLLLVGPVIMLSVRLRPEINWRGRVYRLDSEARLAPSPPQQS